MKHLHRLAGYAFVLLLSTALNIGSTIGSATETRAATWGSTEAQTASAVVEKSAKKTKNSQQNPESTPAPTPAPTPTPPGNLGVQTGRDCSIEIQAQGSGNYTLRATVGNVTVLFAERPVRTAGTVATSDFVARFDELFASSNPNAALTFTGDDRKVRRNNILGEFSEPEPDATGNNHNNNNGPLIVVLSQPRMVGSSSTIIEYNMTQSASQGEVVSIEQFLEMSWVSCSIFIDSAPPANGIDWVT